MLHNILEPFTNPNYMKLHHGTFSIELVMLLVIKCHYYSVYIL